jgi:hypothetical protein
MSNFPVRSTTYSEKDLDNLARSAVEEKQCGYEYTRFGVRIQQGETSITCVTLLAYYHDQEGEEGYVNVAL